MNIHKPLISVIIPTYNRAHYIERALQSVLNQSYTNWEAIVIDNNSNDNTDEIINNFHDYRINLLKIRNNGVIAASRNLGIRAAKGEWLAFLDSDDWWVSGKLEACISSNIDEVDIFYHHLKVVRQKPKIIGFNTIKSRQLKKPIIIDILVGGNPICNSSVVVRKEILDQIRGINEDKQIIGCEDYHTWIRIAQITNKFHCIKKPLGYVYRHDNAIMSQRDLSKPYKYVTSKFNYLLDDKEIDRVNSYINYTKASSELKKGNANVAIKNYLYSLRHGNIIMRLQCIYQILLIQIKSFMNLLIRR